MGPFGEFLSGGFQTTPNLGLIVGAAAVQAASNLRDAFGLYEYRDQPAANFRVAGGRLPPGAHALDVDVEKKVDLLRQFGLDLALEGPVTIVAMHQGVFVKGVAPDFAFELLRGKEKIVYAVALAASPRARSGGDHPFYRGAVGLEKASAKRCLSASGGACYNEKKSHDSAYFQANNA